MSPDPEAGMSKRLSVCLFTRDEAKTIARAVRSVEGVADEVVVADSGSTDGTQKLVRELGGTVVPVTWDDDFSAVRNAALAAATGAWVLWLNPDEELTRPAHEVTRRLVAPEESAGLFGYLVRVQSIPRHERPDLFTESFDLRLFRRRDDARYVGRLHPGFPAALGEAVARDGLTVGPCDVVLRHHAYDSTVTPARLRWAARLLEKELHDRPGRLHYLLEYGRTLLLLGDPKGHDVMAEAAGQVAPYLTAPQPPSPDVQKLLEYLINTPPDQVTPQATAAIAPELAAELTLRWFAESPPLLWALASAYFRNRRYQAAAVLLDLLVKLGASGRYDRSQPFDPRILGPWALVNLGQCYRVLDRPDQARACFASLLDDPEFRDQATRLLAELDGTGPGT